MAVDLTLAQQMAQQPIDTGLWLLAQQPTQTNPQSWWQDTVTQPPAWGQPVVDTTTNQVVKKKPKKKTPAIINTTAEWLAQPPVDDLFWDTGMQKVWWSDILWQGSQWLSLKGKQAEWLWLTKDWKVIDQTKLNDYAIKRSSDAIKTLASKWQQIDQDKLNNIFENTLWSMGIARWSQEFMDALNSIQWAYQQSITGAWYWTVDQSLQELNKKYQELSKLNNYSTNKIYTMFDTLTDEQKNHLKVANPIAYDEALNKYNAKKKVQQYNNEITGNYTSDTEVENIKAVDQETVSSVNTNKSVAEQEYDSYIDTPDLKEAEAGLTKYDEQIAELQRQLEPETLKKDIMSRYKTVLWSSALDALYYDEANDKQNSLKSLVAQKEMAMDNYNRIREENLQRYKTIKDNEEQLISSLLANDWAWLSATSTADIDQYVRDWYMTEAMGKVMKSQLSWFTMKTLQEQWWVSQDNVDQIKSLIDSWVSPQQAILLAMQSWILAPQVKRDLKTIWWNPYKWDETTGQLVPLSASSLGTNENWINLLTTGSRLAQSDQYYTKNGVTYSKRTGSKLQCQSFVNDILTQSWLPSMWNLPYEQRLAKYGTSQTPIVWWFAIMRQPWATGDAYKYWHIGQVVADNWNTVTILEANRDGKWSIRTRDYQKNSIDGYYNPWLQQNQFTQSWSDTLSLIRASKWWWNKATEAERSALTNISDWLWQLWALSDKITEYQWSSRFRNKLAPISWIIAKNNPRNDKSQALKAQMQGIIPSIARGIFWEKWVLTDTDVTNYMKTLPQITNTANANELIQLVFLWALKNKLDSTLKWQARNKIDVSNWEWWYIDLVNEISQLENKLKSWWTTQPTQWMSFMQFLNQ